MDIQEKKNLVNDIASLSEYEHEEIYKIVRKAKSRYSENSNGIFINISLLEPDVLIDINNFVRYCKNKNAEINRMEADAKIEQDNFLNSGVSEENISDNTAISSKIVNSSTVKVLDNVDVITVKDETDETQTTKVILRKPRPKYAGVKAKLIKNCKQKINTVDMGGIKTRKVSGKGIEEYEIGEESYDFLQDPDAEHDDEMGADDENAPVEDEDSEELEEEDTIENSDY